MSWKDGVIASFFTLEGAAKMRRVYTRPQLWCCTGEIAPETLHQEVQIVSGREFDHDDDSINFMCDGTQPARGM